MANGNVLPFIKAAGGGGFLNGVSGLIESITWGDPLVGTDKNGDEYRLLSAEMVVRPDGAEEGVQQFLSAGFLRGDNTVSEDGSTIEGEDEFSIVENTDLAKFLTSLIATGDFDAALLGDGRSLSALAGYRVTFERKADEEKTKRMGMRKDKKNKDPKTGKAREYPQDVLLVTAVLGQPEAAPAKGKKAAAKAPAKAAPAAKAGKKAPAADNSAAVEALKAILAKNKGQIALDKIGPAFVKYSLAANLEEADRKSIRAQIGDAEFLATLEGDGIVFDADSSMIASAE